MQVIREWFKRYSSDPQVVILSIFLLIGFLVVVYLGKMLAPALTALVLAYLMEGLVTKLERLRIPRFAAVTTVYLLFITALIISMIVLMPRLFQQVEKFITDIPRNAEKLRVKIEDLRVKHPHLFIKAEDAQRPAEAMARDLAFQVAQARREADAKQNNQSSLVVISDRSMQEMALRIAPLVLKQLQGEALLLGTNAPPS